MKKHYLTGSELKSLNRYVKRNYFLGLYPRDEEGVIVIPEGVESIPDRAFSGLEGPLTVKLPSSLKSIGKNAFEKCTELTRIEIPEGVRRIPDYCFYDCRSLEEVVLPDSIVEIGRHAFERCYWLSDINFPNSLEVINGSAFCDCDQLDTITINPRLKHISAGAFQGSYIQELKIGAFTEPLQNIGAAFFHTKIESINVDSGSPLYEDALCEVIMEKETGKVILGSVNSIIPNEATAIAGDAFGDLPRFLEIPGNVKRIERHAFSGEGCTFIIKDGVEVIEEFAFESPLWDQNVVYVPASVHTIEGQLSSVEFHLDMGNPFFCYDPDGNNIISLDGELVWGELLEGIPEHYDVNEVLAIVNSGQWDSELIIPSSVSHVGYGIFGYGDDVVYDRIIVSKGTKIDIPEDKKTRCDIKLIVPTVPSASGIKKTIEYNIPCGTLGKEIHDYMEEDSI